MNIKINICFSLTLIVFGTSSCHFGFPDCENDSSKSVLKRSISENTKLKYDEIEIFDFKETDLDDNGFGGSFTCKCSAKYSADRINGSINFSVTRNKSNYRTTIQNNQRKSRHKVLREGETDSIWSLNQVLYRKGRKEPVERLRFSGKPTIGQDHTLFVNGEYDAYTLVSITPLLQHANSKLYVVDSTSSFDEYDFSELLFEFRYKDKVSLFSAKLDHMKYYHVNQNINIENTNNTREAVQLVKCRNNKTREKEVLIVLHQDSNTTVSDTIIYHKAWEIDVGFDQKNKPYQELIELTTERVNPMCWE